MPRGDGFRLNGGQLGEGVAAIVIVSINKVSSWVESVSLISPSYHEETREDTEEDSQQRLLSCLLLGLEHPLHLPIIDRLIVPSLALSITLRQDSDFLLG